jgi:nicotinate-nucleotide--dimethylbenzimidazole phosphoribosyltransferase
MENNAPIKVQNFISEIASTDLEASKQAQIFIDGLVKPPGSLGRLESVAAKIAGITGKIKNWLPKKCIIVMCSDNGVVEEGVASAPKSVTLMQTLNFAKGIAGVTVLAKQVNAEVFIVDVGVDADIDHPQIINRKIRKSTWNISKGPAMTYEEACQAILVGSIW